MCCKNFRARIIPFSLALILGLMAANLFHSENIKPLENTVNPVTEDGFGNDEQSFVTTNQDKLIGTDTTESKPLQIISKPRASYTDAARQNQTEGTVTLRVVFSADGKIGQVTPANKLPDGLTEQAIAAAREIKFEPAMKNGIPQTVTKLVQYSFFIY